MRLRGKGGQFSVVWDVYALKQLKAIFEYIRMDSEQNAQKVKNEIIALTQSLSEHPFRFPADKCKNENDGTYRAFLKYNYRVAYRVTEFEVKILRVRNEKQEPLKY